MMRCGGILKTTEAVCGVDGVVCDGRTENWISSVQQLGAGCQSDLGHQPGNT